MSRLGEYYSDNPIESMQSDSLKRSNFAEHMARIISDIADQDESTVAALIGPWGAGKSSVLHLLGEKLAHDERHQWSVKQFNPWMFTSVDSLLAGFFLELAKALPNDKKLRRKLAGYIREAAPLGQLGSFIGADLSKVAEAVANVIFKPESTEERKATLEQALRAISTKILIVLDDIDRLQPDELLVVLKFIRLIGRLPNVFYVLAFDERTLIDVLRNTDLARGDESRASRYLDKMLQVRFDLPALTDYQRDKIFYNSLAMIMAFADRAVPEAEQLRLQQFYDEQMSEELRNPRSLKRYFAQLRAFFPALTSEVNFVDFCMITYIRTFYGTIYSLLPSWKQGLLGSEPPSVLEIQQKPDPARLAKWKERLDQARVPESAHMAHLDLLGGIFPALRRLAGSGVVIRYGGEIENASRRIALTQYFDRYFQFAVPEDDIADSIVDDALSHFVDGEGENEGSRSVAQLIDTQPSLALAKLRSIATTFECLDPRALVRLIRSRYGRMEIREGKAVLGGPESDARILCSDVLIRCPDSIRRSCLDLLLEDEGIKLGVEVAMTLRRWTDRPEWVSAFTEQLNEAMPDVIERKFGQSIENIDYVDFGIFTTWGLLGYYDQARAFAQRKVDSGEWDFKYYLARLTGTAIMVGTKGRIARISGLDVDSVENFFGVDRAIALAEGLLDQPFKPLRVYEEAPISDEVRIEYALAFLADQRDARRARIEPNEDEPTTQ